MLEITPQIIIALICVAIIGSFIDAVAGGGGMIVMPALLLAGLNPVQAIATNKLQATFGISISTYHFYKKGLIDIKKMRWPFIFALIGSALGAIIVQFVSTNFLKTLAPFMLILVTLYFLVSPSLNLKVIALPFWVFIGCFVFPIAFYDGFFGPGAGSFYLLCFSLFFSYGLVAANANSKFLNFASNVGSLAVFLFSGEIIWIIGFSMMIGQMIGAKIGAIAAMSIGSKLIRPLVVTISAILAIKLMLFP